MTKKNNANSARRKLIPAVGMLVVSAMMLSSSTYAWFSMNKTVSVTGMQMKAQAETGLLVNEMTGSGTVGSGDSAVNNGSYSASATAGQSTAISLRPASTSNLTAWWHANSLKSNSEAGYGENGAVDATNTVEVATGEYYSNIAPAQVSTAVTDAAGDTNAKRTVYYKDAVGGRKSTYDDGEGYYVMYEYYLKSSGNSALTLTADKLTAQVTATLQGENPVAQAIDPALRVGVKIGSDFVIFAPVTGAQTTYSVAGSAAGATYASVTAATTAATAMGASTSPITIPAVQSETGLKVEVYVWFEGEDVACKSDNITAATLNSYEIAVKFTDTDLA